jgi:DNA invertase Pin-like site-specific DNA recombinase
MSSAKQDQSPEQQRAAIAAHCKRNGYEVVREYSDLGIAGDRAVRPGFKKMLAAAESKSFDRIVCYDRSRFGRFDAVGFGQVMAPLRDAGILLETVAEGVVDLDSFGGRIIGMVEQEGKHAYAVDLSRSTTRGLTTKAIAGRGYTGGVTPYGYCRETRVEGRNRISTLSLNPVTAPIVERMFKAYAAPSASLRSIAKMLNEEGIPPAGGGVEWRKGAVMRILLNQVYAGDAVWGRRSTGKYHTRSGGEVVKRRYGAGVTFHEPIVHRGAVPAIVPRELFDRVQNLMTDRQGECRSPTNVRPLSGIVFCKTCGKPLHTDGSDRLRCSSSNGATAGGCSSSRIPTGPLLAAVVSGLQEKVFVPAVLAKVERRLRERLAGRSTDTTRTKAVADQLRKIEAEIATGTERIPMVPPSLLPGLLKTLEAKAAERDRLQAGLDALPAAPALPVDKAVRKAMAALRDLGGLLTQADPAAVNAALRGLGVVVRAAPGGAAKGKRLADVVVGDSSTTGYKSEPVPMLDFRLSFAVAY